MRVYLRLLRSKQWIKNLFVFAPLIFTGRISNVEDLRLTFFVFLIFSLASSIIYILNDIVDREIDGSHSVKSKQRPIASGQISVARAKIIASCLFVIEIAGLYLIPSVAYAVLGYQLINICYTFWLKKQPVLDLFSIASGFVMRVYAGALVISVPLSIWMFVTTLSLALYLAAIKRRQEILSDNKKRDVLKYYNLRLVEKYSEFSSIAALLFYSLYVVTTRPALSITIPFVIYGMFRYWFLVEYYDEGESPTDLIYKDAQLTITVLAWSAVCIFVIVGGVEI